MKCAHSPSTLAMHTGKIQGKQHKRNVQALDKQQASQKPVTTIADLFLRTVNTSLS